jgi:hypothetical protein
VGAVPSGTHRRRADRPGAPRFPKHPKQRHFRFLYFWEAIICQDRLGKKKRKLNKTIAGVVVSKQPAQWDWSGPELVPGWESGPEVFLVVEPGPAKDTVSLRCARRNVFFACHYLKATETPILAKTGSGQTKGNVENKTCFCRHVAVVYVADPVDVDEEDSGAQNAQNALFSVS